MKSFVLVALACVACVGDSQDSTSPYPGTWTCSDTISVTVTGDATDTEPAEVDTLVVTEPTPGNLELADTTVGDDCVIDAASSGTNASVTGGTCTLTDNTTTANVTWNGGSFILESDTTFKGNATGAFTGTASGQDVSGNIAVTFVCSK
jgi:hypothetical protein